MPRLVHLHNEVCTFLSVCVQSPHSSTLQLFSTSELQNKGRIEKREFLKALEEKEALNECTFKPKVTQRRTQRKPQNAEDRKQELLVATSLVKRLSRPLKKEGIEQATSEELAARECTFKPNVNRRKEDPQCVFFSLCISLAVAGPF